MATWERTLTELLQARGPALKRYALVLTGNDAAAEDLLQDALLRVFARHVQKQPENVEPYLRTVMLHRHLDQARRRQRWSRLLPRLAEPVLVGGHEHAVLERHAALAALASLSARQRACIVLRYYEDLSLVQIAQRLAISEGAVKRYMADALRRLAPELLPAEDGGTRD